ncbi:nuclear pore protein 84/107 [Pseudomassariella vexata]|uniref:Nuclear pore complex protein n=1 Tax=Pseudomassariella vexata TaxID=1141098 RepID=A0A1Y2E4P3_9PEZI|nr:nuclear pore protein 84/107 [Pseudomassariella vexata]ORY66489.1 nuclear pore protein 84/107 [Pseudomassariella vexata]
MDDQILDENEGNEFAHDAERFAKALDVISGSSQSPSEKRADIFKLVDVYYELAAGKVHSLRPAQKSSTYQRPSMEESDEDMDVDEAETDGQKASIDGSVEHWELEAQTWDLLRRLLPLRYPDRKITQPKRREPSRFQTGPELWDEFLQTESTAQERKAILEVLQKTADESRPDIDDIVRDYQQKAERGDILAFGWLHTRSAIKMQKRINGWTGPLDPSSADVTSQHTDSNGTPLVSQLDPDVVTRQSRKLQPQDEYFERAIWIGCYELLRRGRSLAEIRDWCVERTEVWRAVSMSAMPLSRETEDDRAVSNPLAILLWRRTCFALARQGGSDDYERAVYGILSGDIQSVEKVCQTWDDYVFAHYNALLRTQFDSYIMKRSAPEATQAITQSLSAFNAVQFHGDPTSVGERLVTSLETNSATSKEAKTPMKSLQAAIVSDTVSQYIINNGVFLGRSANQKGVSALIPAYGKQNSDLDDTKYFTLKDENQLRVLVHVYLLLSSLDKLHGVGEDDMESQKAQENVVASYVSALRLMDLFELIPIYCSKLQGERAFFTLSRNFAGLADLEERRTMLRIMEKLGMDIGEFVVFQPLSLLKEHPENINYLPVDSFTIFTNDPPSLKYGRRLKPDFLGEAPESLDPVDEQLIQSLEWMMLVDGLWDETLSTGVAIYKRFLKHYNIHAARALSDRVKCADIFRHKARLAISDDTDLSWFTDIDDNDPLLYEDGTPRQMVTARNYLELESLVRALDCMETVASSAGIAHEPARDALTRDFWSHLGGQVKLIKSFMQPLLRGWLKESIDEEEEFELLREMYLPEIILGYVSVLHFAGTSLSRDNLLECMELAALIAEKDSDIAGVLMKCGRMEELVKGFANGSKALAVSGGDKKVGGGGSSKKMREMGWSRDLWSVKR